MYNSTRPKNLSTRGDWRNSDIKRAISPSLVSDEQGSTRQQQNKYGRRPLPTASGQSVAALQQHHQWLMQQQDTKPSSRSVSPLPTKSSTRSNDNLMTMKQYTNPHKSNNEVEVVFGDDNEIEDDEEEGDDVEEERMVVIQDIRARSPSINRGSGGSIMSVSTQQASSYYHPSPAGSQEFKIVREGWLYRKNGLMQWKPVYAVAKHGNAVKPGGLYLYKDIKCTNHIHTYDMSEVLEVSPRAQDYKQGIKWEIRMLIKRDDVILATDDMLTRKDWIESLTSIMGKVSIATQNELTSRIQNSEQMNRNLRDVAEELDSENNSLKEEIASLKEALSKKDRFFQQELQNRESELKEAFAKKERLSQQEYQTREEELNNELDRQRQTLETKCEIFEREAMQWRKKYNELESKTKFNHDDIGEKQQNRIESLQIEVRRWRNRVDDLERQQKRSEIEKNDNERYSMNSINSYNNESQDSIKETMSDVKFNLQILRDQIKSSSDGPLLDIKANVNKLCDTLDSAKSSWSELQTDIVKFLENEKQDSDINNSNQKHLFELLRSDVTDLKEEILGVSAADKDENDENKKAMPSLTEKFDILIEMVENLQIGQSRLSSSIMENASSSGSTASSLSDMPGTPTNEDESPLYKAVTSQQKQLADWIEESREIHNSTITSIESNLRQNRSLPSVPSDISRLHDKITETIENALNELQKNQEEGQEEQGKNIKAIGNYLKLITKDIENSSIPDLPALSQQLEDVVERLNTTEERLSMLNSSPSWTSGTSMENNSIGPQTPISDEDKLAQLYGFVKNTERFMERALRVLSRYGDNPSGMEETIRRAVKGASKAQLEEVMVLQDQNKSERENAEKKMQRYEENARSYFDKSMEKMHSDLHEFTGVMYEMLEGLVIKALEHNPGAQVGSEVDQQKSIQSIVELHGKLSGLNQALRSEISRLEEEKEKLKTNINEMRKKSRDLEQEIDEQHKELRSVQSEYNRVSDDIARSRRENVANLAEELEPLLSQISKLKMLAGGDVSDVYNDMDSREKKSANFSRAKSPLPSRHEDEEDGGRKLRFPPPNMMSQQFSNNDRRNSFNSDSSDNNYNSATTRQQTYDQSSIKSPLIGSRDRPRVNTIMYKSNAYGYDHSNMSWAVARQDEALEDLIKSTRRIIKKHTDYMADTRYSEQPQYYHHRPSFSHKRPSCSYHYTNRVHPPQPPPLPPKHYHKSYHHSYSDYAEPHKHYKSQSSPPLSREYYNKSPENSFSRTKRWLNRLRPSNYYHSAQYTHSKGRESQHPYEDHGTDDEIGLFELKEKIRRTSSIKSNKLPLTSSNSRPMIIPAAVGSNPEKVIVIDVPLDTTVIFRSVDQPQASVHQITDLRQIEKILGGSSTDNHNTSKIESPPRTKKTFYKTKAEKNLTVPIVIKTSATMPNLSQEPSTASTIVSSKLATPVKKKSGLTKYFSTLNISRLSGDSFNYVDSDDSTVEEVSDRANNDSIQSLRTPSLSEEESETEEETFKRRTEKVRQGALPRSRSDKQWML